VHERVDLNGVLPQDLGVVGKPGVDFLLDAIEPAIDAVKRCAVSLRGCLHHLPQFFHVRFCAIRQARLSTAELGGEPLLRAGELLGESLLSAGELLGELGLSAGKLLSEPRLSARELLGKPCLGLAKPLDDDAIQPPLDVISDVLCEFLQLRIHRKPDDDPLIV
jgi:hypothetical protein